MRLAVVVEVPKKLSSAILARTAILARRTAAGPCCDVATTNSNIRSSGSAPAALTVRRYFSQSIGTAATATSSSSSCARGGIAASASAGAPCRPVANGPLGNTAARTPLPNGRRCLPPNPTRPLPAARSFSTKADKADTAASGTGGGNGNGSGAGGGGSDAKKWMYAFAGLLLMANLFTVWQETDAHDGAQRRAEEYEANKKAWEERERLEATEEEERQRQQQQQQRQQTQQL